MYLINPDVLRVLIRLMGGQAALARHLGVSRQRLNNWLNRRDKVPLAFILAMATASEGKITCYQLAPTLSKEKIAKDLLLPKRIDFYEDFKCFKQDTHQRLNAIEKFMVRFLS